MLLGTDMQAVISTFSSFPLAGLGMNCATGPKAMGEHVRILSENSPFNISILPNAGLPTLKEGKYIYDLTPEELAFDMHKFVTDFGINMVGGCCGTTPAHIKALAGISRLVKHEEFRTALIDCTSEKEFFTLVEEAEKKYL